MVKNGSKVSKLKEGTTFGDNALRKDMDVAKRSASIIADGEVFCITLSRKTIIDNFGKDLK